MTVPGIIGASEFLAANQALTARLRGPGRGGGRPSDALLRPFCGRCGAPMYKWGKSYRCAGIGPNGNSTQRDGCGVTILVAELDAAIPAEFVEYDEPEVIETRIPGVDHLDEIAAVQLAVRDLNVMADDYDHRHAELMTELRRLKALPVTPAKIVTVFTGQSEGDAFRAMDLDERRAFIGLWKLTVFPPGTEPRWALTYHRQRGPEDVHRDRWHA